MTSLLSHNQKCCQCKAEAWLREMLVTCNNTHFHCPKSAAHRKNSTRIFMGDCSGETRCSLAPGLTLSTYNLPFSMTQGQISPCTQDLA